MASTVMQNGSLLIARILPAQAEELLPVDLERPADSWRNNARSSCGAKTSLPAGTGVCVVKQVPAATASRAVAKSSLCSSIMHADAFQAAKRRVPFVHVADGRRLAEGPQGPDAADAQDHFLADAHVVIAAVEPGGDLPIVGVVLRDVGVEQIQRHPADLNAPDRASTPRGPATAR